MSAPAEDSVARVRATFDAVADDYDQTGVPFFVPTAEGLVDALAPRPGERALDIGCGRGAATLPLARAVLPSGRLTAIDLSPAMVGHTSALLAREGLGGDVVVMDASAPELPPGEHDVIASSLVLFFLPDAAAALASWVRLLAPGGRIGLATMGESHPVWRQVDALFRPWLPPGMLDPKVVDPHGHFSSDAAMESLLTAAGARDVHTVTRRVDVPWGDVGGWRAFSMSTGQRAMWARVPTDERPGLIDRAGQLLETAHDATGRVVVWQDMRYTLGRAPAA